jgi:hypothetical protein
VAFFLAIHPDNGRADATIGRQPNATNRRLCGVWLFIVRLKTRLASVILPDSRISAGITELQVLNNLSSGGEGGIRTPGRGVSPYNGLAILCIDATQSNLNHLYSHSRTTYHPM